MRGDSGFSLLELMVAVIIAAILAGIASVVYSGYRRRTLATEAQVNLALIASAEEAYKAEFGVYAAASENPPAAALPCGTRADFTNPGGSCSIGCAEFRVLGFRPENPWVAFKYTAWAGTTTPTGGAAWASGPDLIPAGTEAQGWFALEARGNLVCPAGSLETTYRMVDRRSDIVARLNEYQ